MPPQTPARRGSGPSSIVMCALVALGLMFGGTVLSVGQHFHSLNELYDAVHASDNADDGSNAVPQSSSVITLSTTNAYILSTTVSNNKRCMDVPGNRRENEQVLQQRDCDGSLAQQFELVHGGGEFFKFKFSDLCVVMRAKGMDVALVVCADFADQYFAFKPTGNSGEFVLKPKHDSNMCLEVLDSSDKNGARLVGNPCTGNPNQKFQLRYSNTGITASLPGYRRMLQ